MGRQAIYPSIAAASVIPMAVGADFVMYGPIEHAEYVFPSVAMTDAEYGQLRIEPGKMLDSSHPIFKIA